MFFYGSKRADFAQLNPAVDKGLDLPKTGALPLRTRLAGWYEREHRLPRRTVRKDPNYATVKNQSSWKVWVSQAAEVLQLRPRNQKNPSVDVLVTELPPKVAQASRNIPHLFCCLRAIGAGVASGRDLDSLTARHEEVIVSGGGSFVLSACESSPLASLA